MNTMWFCSMDKRLLQQLFDKFRSCFDTICEGKVADLLKKHGYSGAEADRRDYITGCDGIISRNEAYYYFQAEIISAWAPHMDVLFKLIREKYADKIRLLYGSKERILLVFAEPVNLVDEKDGAPAVEEPRMFCLVEHLTHIFHPTRHGAERIERHFQLVGHDEGERGFAHTGWPP